MISGGGDPVSATPDGRFFAAIAFHRLRQWMPALPAEGLVVYRCLSMTVVFLSVVSTAHAESGLASFYGGRGHGGELTCAHRTRPFGTMVTVTSNAGRSIRCRVNDRGPFIRGRIIDVSLSAARALGMMRSGVIRVSVE